MVLDTKLRDQIAELIDRKGFAAFYDHLLLALADRTLLTPREAEKLPRDKE
jgi:hypothetical protein